MELIIVLIIALIVFGPKRLPEMGRSLGRGIREFKSSVTSDDDKDRQLSHRGDEQTQHPASADDSQPIEGEVVGDPKA